MLRGLNEAKLAARQKLASVAKRDEARAQKEALSTLHKKFTSS